MQKYTVSEIVQKFAIPESKVRRRIKKGLLPTMKEKEGTQEVTKVLIQSEEMLRAVIDGRDFRLNSLDLEDDKNNDIQEVKDVEFTRLSHESHSTDDTNLYELIKDMYYQNKNLVEDVKKYAELAGQTKLLTDSENRTKQEYFQLSQENKLLVQEKAELKAKLDILEEKLNQQNNNKHNISSWFKRL